MKSRANRWDPRLVAVEGEFLDFNDVINKFEKMMDWLAGVYVNAMNVIHYMHDKYAYERVEMALHDYAPVQNDGFWHGRDVGGCRQSFSDSLCKGQSDSR